MPTAIAVIDGSRSPVLPASAAEAVDFEPVAGREESMIGGHALEPTLQAAVDDFDDAVAPRAEEVMVVLFSAAPVTGFAWMVTQRVDHPRFRQGVKCPVDRCQSQPLAALT
jgi:hypothetical protein